MRRRITILIFLINYSYSCFSQLSNNLEYYQGEEINKRDSNNLKTGKWIYFQNYYPEETNEHNLTEKYTSIRYYNVIILNDTSICTHYIEKSNEGNICWDKNGEAFYFDNKSGNYFSVRNGLEVETMSNNINRIIDWDNGFIKRIYFVNNGEINEVQEDKHTNGLRITDTYRNHENFIYNRYTSFGNGRYLKCYFPDCDVFYKGSRFHLSSTNGSSDSLRLYLHSNIRDTIKIDSIFGYSNQLKIYNNNNELKNAIIFPYDSFELLLIYNPDRNFLRENDTLKFYTKNRCEHGFNINISYGWSDISDSNINEIKELYLIKTDNVNYLYIYLLNSECFFVDIYNSSRTKKLISKIGENGMRVDISNLNEGKYKLLISVDFQNGNKRKYEIDLNVKKIKTI